MQRPTSSQIIIRAKSRLNTESQFNLNQFRDSELQNSNRTIDGVGGVPIEVSQRFSDTHRVLQESPLPIGQSSRKTYTRIASRMVGKTQNATSNSIVNNFLSQQPSAKMMTNTHLNPNQMFAT